VVDDKLTGEVLLDEALKMMKVSERMSVGTWIDLMSGKSSSHSLFFLFYYPQELKRELTVFFSFSLSLPPRFFT